MFLHWLARFFCFLFCKLFFHFEVKGRGNVPQKGGFVLVSNHSSFLDPVLLSSACPRVLNYLARDSLFKNPLFGWWLLDVGVFPVKRWSADLSAIRKSVLRLRNGRGLAVFPEGTRSPDGGIKDFSQGFALLADKAGVPIVPARITGSYRAWGKGSLMIRPVKIRVIFGERVYLDKKQPYLEIARQVSEKIKMMY